MKIAILGGGLTGLTASYYLAKKGHQITVFEKESILGGLTSGFKSKSWAWPLERTYHHLFASDTDILNFAKEIKFNKIFYQKPITASLYLKKALPLDTPFDLLKFPYLSLVDRIRTGLVIAFLKISPFLPFYEKLTSEDFLIKSMGKNVWNILWQELFRKKYGDYAGIILSSFIWARIKKRTKALGYVKGGFQEFIDYIANKSKGLSVDILVNSEIKKIIKKNGQFIVNEKSFDKVISTLPTPVMTQLTKKIFKNNYLLKFNKLRYLHAVTLIMETEKPILEKTYWLNVCNSKIPFMIFAQHTNFVDKKFYGNKHISYIGWYVDEKNPLLKMDKNEVLNFVLPHLNKISKLKFKISNFYLFKAPWAQPIFDKEFVKNKPTFITPDKNFFVANLDMTYPYDRGTNYAVKLGKDVANLIDNR